MISTVIIDDDEDARLTLIELLTLSCPMVKVVGQAEGVQTGIHLINTTLPDLVFLDIQMMDGTGFDLLDHILHNSFHLIFTTSYSEFAVRAFEYSATDYLLKPIDPDKLGRAVQKASLPFVGLHLKSKVAHFFESMQIQKNEKIILSSQEGLVFIAIKDIIRLEAEGSYTTFHATHGKQAVVTKNIKSYEAILPKNLFHRPHQSHIISLDHISKVVKEEGSYILMEDGMQIPISRRRKEAFFSWLSQQHYL